VKQMVQWKNKISGLLLRYGVEDVDSRRAGQRSSWSELEGCPDLPEPVAALIRRAIPLRDLLSRSERDVVKHAARHPLIAERVRRLRTIPGVGLLTALTWTLEIGEVERFPSGEEGGQLLRTVRRRLRVGRQTLSGSTLQAAQPPLTNHSGGGR
jgi:transposase